MSEKLPNGTNPEDEKIAQRLSHVAEQTHANPQFATELEERLRRIRQQKPGPLTAAFKQTSPTLRWAVLMLLLAVALSWSIRTLIPAPQPADNITPTTTEATTTTPTPSLPPEETAIPATQEGGFDFRDSKLYLEGPLPESPNQAHVYLLKKDEPATEEQARAMADRFGIQGEMYTTPGYVFGNENYFISDGRQSLEVYSQRLFTYIADLSKTSRISTNTPNENAEAVIREFLQARGFDFPFSILSSDLEYGYTVRPLSPDSIPMQYESFTLPVLRVTLDEAGQVLSVDASLMEYDPAPIGEYGIISAQQAFEHLLDDYALAGKMEYVTSSAPMRDWFRKYPDNQTVTTYGYISIYPAAESGKPSLVLIDGVPVIGNTNGLESLERFTLVKATGQYLIENGIRTFNVESWDQNVQEMPFPGTLSREGDQIILTTNDGQHYPLIDPPADPPLDIDPFDSMLEVYGVLEDGRISWTFMRLFENSGSGGGGGGNVPGFFRLNLTGTPVPFPSPAVPPPTNLEYISYLVQENDTLASIASNYGITVEALMQANGITENQVFTGQTLVIPMAEAPAGLGLYTVKEGDTLSAIAQNFDMTVEELLRINNLTDSIIYVGQSLSVSISAPVEQPVQDLRGYLAITINNKSDGTSAKEYTLEAISENGASIYTMEGPVLSELDPYNGLPILVTGTINTRSKLVVESYKIPYPNLQFQIVKGTQSIAQLDGQDVIIFTTEDGTSYVEFLVTNATPLEAESIMGQPGDTIQQEVLVIPDETFGGLPVIRVYQRAIVQEGEPDLEIQANKILVQHLPDDPMMSPDYRPPNLTIDHVELVYYVSNPYYQVNDPNYSQRSPYIEPAWHFVGHYEDGTQFDVLIQAIKQEFLLPERVPSPGMG